MLARTKGELGGEAVVDSFCYGRAQLSKEHRFGILLAIAVERNDMIDHDIAFGLSILLQPRAPTSPVLQKRQQRLMLGCEKTGAYKLGQSQKGF